MSEAEVLEKITAIMREFFDEYDGPIENETNAADIDQWDSLANVQFMVLIEQSFKLRFATNEITHLKDLGELVGLVCQKTA